MGLPQWLIETYDCECANYTEPCPGGGMRTVQFCCEQCLRRGLFLLEHRSHAVTERERAYVTSVMQLSLGLEVNRVLEPTAPPATGSLPEGS